ncbi:FAD-dependent oxidoreductase [Flavobacterium ardleyense]|uniref:FAD-dependent oxidoreductase n=1 Tax=Flavobacterium ardleyense TaxID=2038737 RepID=UPI00298CAD25|nr:FAD-dependent oxidoreductase [Flavobacterium ardleyense]
MFDVLIIGGGAAGVSCALVLGSAHKREFAHEKKVGIIAHQKASALQDAVLNNAYGMPLYTLGSDTLTNGLRQLQDAYPHITQIAKEKVSSISGDFPLFTITTNKNIYQARSVVIAVGNSNSFNITGLQDFVIPHMKTIADKNRIQLINTDHQIAQGMYVAGTLAGWRSQVAIAAGSGAAVATDILTMWNNGIDTHSHDSLR